MNSFAVKRALFAVVCLGLFSVFQQASAQDQPASTNQVSQDGADFKEPKTLDELLRIPASELKSVDMARMNLLCAEGLPTTEHMNIDKDLATIDRWAEQIKQATANYNHRFIEHPEEFHWSYASFRMIVLITILERDWDRSYDPRWRVSVEATQDPENGRKFFSDPQNLFIHGLIDDHHHYGACGTLPVMVKALATRLGYPVKLVGAKSHCFVRWEGEGEKFNIECTHGFDIRSDDFYRKWPFPISPTEEKDEKFLKSMSPAEELTQFLRQRFVHFSATQQWGGYMKAANAAQRYSYSPDVASETEKITKQLEEQIDPREFKEKIGGIFLPATRPEYASMPQVMIPGDAPRQGVPPLSPSVVMQIWANNTKTKPVLQRLETKEELIARFDHGGESPMMLIAMANNSQSDTTPMTTPADYEKAALEKNRAMTEAITGVHTVSPIKSTSDNNPQEFSAGALYHNQFQQPHPHNNESGYDPVIGVGSVTENLMKKVTSMYTENHMPTNQPMIHTP